MRWRAEWTAAGSAPARAAVLRDQGLPEGDRLSPRIGALVDGALEMYRALAEPRGILADVDAGAFLRLYEREGRNAARSPLPGIVPRAEALALFVCTVGSRVSHAIADLFVRHDPAQAHMLDAVASLAADGLSTAAGRELLVRLETAGALGEDACVLPYSPGYCGWHVTGQRALFDALDPAEIGVTLNASCLMQPLKSVSGVLVVAPPDAHEFHPDFPCCEDCRTRQCLDRMASLRGAQQGEGGGPCAADRHGDSRWTAS